MSEPVKPEDVLPVEYALGLTRDAERRDVTARLASDANLRSEIEAWQKALAELDGVPASMIEEAPPAELFDNILNRIDAEGLQLPGTRTKRAGAAKWREVAPGVMSRVLHVDRANNRQSLLLKMQAGAIYYPHSHDADEESFIVEGDLWFGDLELGAGDYHVASASSRHPTGRSVGGCIVHVVTSLSH